MMGLMNLFGIRRDNIHSDITAAAICNQDITREGNEGGQSAKAMGNDFFSGKSRRAQRSRRNEEEDVRTPFPGYHSLIHAFVTSFSPPKTKF